MKIENNRFVTYNASHGKKGLLCVLPWKNECKHKFDNLHFAIILESRVTQAEVINNTTTFHGIQSYGRLEKSMVLFLVVML